MTKPTFPGALLPAETIRAIREKQAEYDRNPERYEQHEQDWALEACIERGCLPSGEPIEALYGAGPWSERHD